MLSHVKSVGGLTGGALQVFVCHQNFERLEWWLFRQDGGHTKEGLDAIALWKKACRLYRCISGEHRRYLVALKISPTCSNSKQNVLGWPLFARTR